MQPRTVRIANIDRPACEVLSRLYGWLAEHAERINSLTVRVSDDGMVINVESVSEMFDMDLNGWLAEFLSSLGDIGPSLSGLVYPRGCMPGERAS